MEKGKGEGEGIKLIANRLQRIEDSGTRYGVRGMGYGVCEPCLIKVDSPQQINTLTNQHINLLTRVRVRGMGCGLRGMGSWVPETGQPIGFLVKLSSRIGPPGGPSMRDPESG